MPQVLRYVARGEIRGHFIKFIHCDTGLTGSAIAQKIKSSVNELGLGMNDCRKQCYKGASNMAGKCAGEAA